ncbi:ABC transporter substrate-binding protein [Marinobacter salexigens]|uniref:ABC transporter substrate-binding protein n=1 Tax=Marinobacter salexigens TaxID=1925763 RepID=UPI001EFE6FFA|nr:ABC transporter substrate-binding protein [Marinobacter salexigens]
MKDKVLFIKRDVIPVVKFLTAAKVCAFITIIMLVAPLAVLAEHNGKSPVYLVGSGNRPLDDHMRTLLEKELENPKDLTVITAEQAVLADGGPIVTIGPAAFSRIRQANRNASVLALLVEPDFLEPFARHSSGQISGVYHGASLLRQALIGKAILPQATRIALISTTGSAELYEELIDQLPAYNLEARLFVVDDEKQLIPTLNRALSYGDFLLAAPDKAIYNPRTIKHVLLTAYRRNRIVVGPSRAYVKAGAIASGYVPFPAIAQMAATYLQTLHETGKFPEPDYPREFRTEINEQVARSLNIPLATQEQITRSVERRMKNTGGPGDE